MSKTIHICLDIRGALRWGKSKMCGIFRDESGRVLTPDEAQEYLFDCLAKGWRVIPLTHTPCEGFSYETGCPGHPVAEDAARPEGGA